MNKINFRILDALHNKLNISEEKALQIVEIVDAMYPDKKNGKINEINSLGAEDVLNMERRIKSDIKQSKLNIYKAFAIAGIVQIVAILLGFMLIAKFLLKL